MFYIFIFRLAAEKPTKPEHFVTQATVTRPPINTRPPTTARPPPANIITLSTKAPVQLATKPTISTAVSLNTLDEGKILNLFELTAHYL